MNTLPSMYKLHSKPFVHGRKSTICRNQGEFSTQAKRFAKDIQRKVDKFVEENKLKQKAKEVANSTKENVKRGFAEAQDSAYRTFVQIEREYDLEEKARKATRRFDEAVRDVDQKYAVKRKFQNFKDYINRNLPIWQKQYSSFATSPFGRAAIFVGTILLLTSPFFWSFLNFIFLLWWILIPVSILLLDMSKRQQLREAQAARTKQESVQDIFSRFQSQSRQQDGQVIDVEWVTIDDDTPRRKKK